MNGTTRHAGQSVQRSGARLQHLRREVCHYDQADQDFKNHARQDSEESLNTPLEVFRTYFVRDGFIGDGDHPSIADIRFAATIEFMAMNEGGIPDWAAAYRDKVEAALGDAYTVPAGDVRGFVSHVKSAAK